MQGNARIRDSALRVLQIPPGELPVTSGIAGSEQTIFLLSKYLRRAGHRVTIIDRLHNGELTTVETVDGVEIIRTRSWALSGSALTHGVLPLERLRHGLNRLAFGLFARSPDPIESYDVVQVHDLFVLIALILRAFLRGTRPRNIVYSHHSSMWPHSGSGLVSSLPTKVLGLLSRRLHAITVESLGTQELFARAGVPLDKIWLLPPPREVEKFLVSTSLTDVRESYRLSEQPIVLYVGRVAFEKGIDTLIRAFGFLTHELNVSAQLVIVGPESFDAPSSSSSYIASLGSLARDTGVVDRIRFTGPVPSSDLLRFYNLCYVLVLPSRRETFGSVITEAMAAGKPVVATRTPGALMQVRDGWNGYLVDIEDYRAMGRRIASILVNDHERERMGKNALGTSRAFASDKIVESYSRSIRMSLQGVSGYEL